MRSRNEGDPCPECGKPMVLRPAAFAWRGEICDGVGCIGCASLFTKAGEEISPLREDDMPKFSGLAIGGPLDGRDIEHTYSVFRAPDDTLPPVATRTAEGFDTTPVGPRWVEYHFQPITVALGFWIVHKGMKLDDALRAFLSAYRSLATHHRLDQLPPEYRVISESIDPVDGAPVAHIEVESPHGDRIKLALGGRSPHGAARSILKQFVAATT